MSTRVGNETWAMNDRQAAAIVALKGEYPALAARSLSALRASSGGA